MLSVRRLSPAEWSLAFPVVSQLRKLDESTFVHRVQRQSYSGYELVGAFVDETLIAVMGMRPVHTLARGPHLHVDDLVVDERYRQTGAGRALMSFAENDARARCMNAVFLDARPDAIPFYQKLDFELHLSPSMKKAL
ncbi:GNAT family N-acetyltransferase [Paludibacterium purpuratum]|uniref:Acetyltransferase (GNAT) family protein n=1 Tax=Paludibacterium purpuratum TaxID=1144873 RepID=A0A4R7BDU6_9NEIS|nr:GNAT family N-acetyltransferase [Paludibacterium purpuratum]TDR81936.1 acetyltransferase (GNAT) family protein [Paludibacterium purpuratum]